MTVWAVLLAFVGAANPIRRRPCLSVADRRQVLMGSAAALVAYAVLALLGASVREALDVSTPNGRVAAGLVLVVVGLHAVVAPLPAAQVPTTARTGWLVPVLFPVLLRPDLALVAFAADRTSGVLTVALSAAVALAAVVAWWLVGRPRSRPAPAAVAQRDLEHPKTTTWERGLGALLGAFTVIAAVRLLLDGVFAL